MTLVKAPSRIYLETLVECPNIDGYLSLENGFFPPASPLERLPESHSDWEYLALSLPELFKRGSVRLAINKLPLISADESALDDKFLPRAAMVLGIIAHCYWRCTKIPRPIPDNLRLPWQEVTQRLGRPGISFTMDDLFINNWRLLDPDASDPIRIENMELLVKAHGNEEERVFFLSFVEMTARAKSLVKIAIEVQEAVLNNDVEALKLQLLNIKSLLGQLIKSFLKISLSPHSRTYINPIIWSKTVAPFGVPEENVFGGTSGIMSPIFVLLDCLFGRSSYQTEFGQESAAGFAWLPQAQQGFLKEIRRVSLQQFVNESSDNSLSEIYNDTLDAYLGESGFLSVHRNKVYGVLNIAMKLGRLKTVGGFDGAKYKQSPWNKACTNLDESQAERSEVKAQSKCPFGYVSSRIHEETSGKTAAIMPAKETKEPLLKSTNLAAQKSYKISELVAHNNSESGYWVAIDQKVYDMSQYMQLHPGGTHLIALNSGREADLEFHQVLSHNTNKTTQRILASNLLGSLSPIKFKNTKNESHFNAWVQLLYSLVEIQTLLEADWEVETVNIDNIFAVRESIRTHKKLLENILPAFKEELLNVWKIAGKTSGCPYHTLQYKWQSFQLKKQSSSVESDYVTVNHLPFDLDQYEDIKGIEKMSSTHILNSLLDFRQLVGPRDKRLIQELKAITVQVVELFETYADAVSHKEILQLSQQMQQLIDNYFKELFPIIQHQKHISNSKIMLIYWKRKASSYAKTIWHPQLA